MKEIQYLIGDATSPSLSGNRIIAHICNDVGGWGKGFVMAISKKWEQPEAEYRSWYQNRNVNGFGLGRTMLVKVEESLFVANMVAQRDVKTLKGIPPIRYEALKGCLSELALAAIDLNASIHMPRIGCGLAGGTWDKVEPIIVKTLIEKGISVFVYDLM